MSSNHSASAPTESTELSVAGGDAQTQMAQRFELALQAIGKLQASIELLSFLRCHRREAPLENGFSKLKYIVKPNARPHHEVP